MSYISLSNSSAGYHLLSPILFLLLNAPSLQLLNYSYYCLLLTVLLPVSLFSQQCQLFLLFCSGALGRGSIASPPNAPPLMHCSTPNALLPFPMLHPNALPCPMLPFLMLYSSQCSTHHQAHIPLNLCQQHVDIMATFLPCLKDGLTLIKEEDGIIDLGLPKDEFKVLPS